MNKFSFLENHPHFKRKFDSGNHIFYYYEMEGVFHAQIFIPKTWEYDFSWNYYKNKKNISAIPTELPNWFCDLVRSSSRIVYNRDRLRRLVNAKSNSFYKNIGGNN